MKKITKNDIILIAVILLLSAIIFAVVSLTTSQGNTVEIQQNGKVIKTLSLNQNAVYDIKNDGEITNTVTVKDGYAYMSYADCPDKICKNHSKINKSGESIICLPNEVVVTVTANKSNSGDEIDGVAR